MSLFLLLSGISLNQFCQKSVFKSWVFRKKDKIGDGHIVGIAYRRGEIQTFNIR